MELIVTEKDNAARRLSEIRSGGSYETERRAGTTVYRWGATRCLGLSGHVVELDFPSEYSDWRHVEPAELIDAPVAKEPTKPDIVTALQSLAREADRVIVATDYDREGELIGKEAYELVREVAPDVQIDRVRFSSITDREVNEAFENPDEIDFDLAAAGEARQVIDLVWGAALTRFLSLSAGQLGEDFISVGRVQGPTLKLLVDREREIRAFDPDDYWELFADLRVDGDSAATDDASGTAGPGASGATATDASGATTGDNTTGVTFEAQYFYEDEDGREAERVFDEARAERVAQRLAAAESAHVTAVRRRDRTDTPPAPFDTTAFISAAGSLGYGAQEAMDVAEELYTAGYVTYPRTDNTVYPEDLDERELLGAFDGHETFGDAADRLLDRPEIDPTEGDEETTDHPPIHPTTELPDRGDLTDDEWELYELIVRRFFATCAAPAEWEDLRIVSRVDDTPAGDAALADGGTRTAPTTDTGPGESGEGPLSLKANGRRLVSEGYHAVYPYRSANETILPDVTEGAELTLVESRSEAKQTQPPRRYGQSRLVEKMKELGVGTKSTRHNTIEKLYERNYVEGDPPRPTRLAEAVVDAAEAFAEQVVTEEMTAQLEADMAAIADGEMSYEEATAESRELLDRVFDELTDSREEVGERLRDSLKADLTLGPCPECGADLLIRESRGSHFVGCDGYPSCEFTLPLPSTGRPLLLDETCPDHDLHHVKMLAGRKTFVHGCPRCKAEEAAETDDVHLGPCPECGAEAGGEVAVKRLRSGNRLVGCTRYPDCDYSDPFPRNGEVVVTDERCEEHGMPHVELHEDDDEPWELGCPLCNARDYRARQAGSELQTVEGIGEATAEKLEAAGVESVADLTDADAESLAETVEGVSADQISEWQDAA
ncbi:MAG: DNA topoisomerase, partial [Halobaculum sp.]